METAVTKGKGIDHLVSGYTPGKVEEAKQMQVMGDNKLKRLLERYKELFDKRNGFPLQYLERKAQIDLRFQDVLSPGDINAFLLMTKEFAGQKYNDDLTSLLLSRLIQNSYVAGEREFRLHVPQKIKAIAYLGGSEEGKLKLHLRGDFDQFCCADSCFLDVFIDGNVGLSFAMKSEDSSYHIKGNVDHQCAIYAKRCFLLIEGDADGHLAEAQKECSLTIHGNTGASFANICRDSFFEVYGDTGENSARQVENSTFIFHGKVDGNHSCLDSTNCLFKTDNRKSLETLIKWVPDKTFQDKGPSGNKVIFIHADGREEVIRKYGK